VDEGKGLKKSEALIPLQDETRASYERHLSRNHTQTMKSVKGTNNFVNRLKSEYI